MSKNTVYVKVAGNATRAIREILRDMRARVFDHPHNVRDEAKSLVADLDRLLYAARAIRDLSDAASRTEFIDLNDPVEPIGEPIETAESLDDACERVGRKMREILAPYGSSHNGSH